MDETKQKIKQILIEADGARQRRATGEWLLRVASSLILLAAFVSGGLYYEMLSDRSKSHYATNDSPIHIPGSSK